ncbi:hypothetical protein FVEN_g11369 [Fusarium venenatum]|nr:hypothetical protein FVEN_g11369 [Fusarium venenatum]
MFHQGRKTLSDPPEGLDHPVDTLMNDEFGEEYKQDRGGGGGGKDDRDKDDKSENKEVKKHEDDDNNSDDDQCVYPTYVPLIPTCGLCRFYLEPDELMVH